jgi:hypothetical protein
MNPEDSVLMGVIKSKKDFDILRQEGWYRIPVARIAREPQPDYMAFFLSKQAFGEQYGGIFYYAKFAGQERATRAELLPQDANQNRAGQVYYNIQVTNLQAKDPPIRNSQVRRVSFIYTPWDRFENARKIDDLFLEGVILVVRVFHALEDKLPKNRSWQREGGYPPQQAQLRVLCERGESLATPYPGDGILITDDVQGSVDRIHRDIDARGGPRMIPIILD